MKTQKEDNHYNIYVYTHVHTHWENTHKQKHLSKHKIKRNQIAFVPVFVLILNLEKLLEPSEPWCPHHNNSIYKCLPHSGR